MRISIAGRLFLAAGVICAVSSLACAQGMPGAGVARQGMAADKPQPPLERAFAFPGAQGRWWNNPRVAESLKLTEDQQKAMDGILMQHREKLIDLRASLQKADLRFEELVGSEPPDESAILAQIDKVAQARTELEKANARFLLAIWNKLTPDQRKQVRELRAGGWPRANWGADGMRQRDMMRNRPDRGPARPDAAPNAPQPEVKQ